MALTGFIEQGIQAEHDQSMFISVKGHHPSHLCRWLPLMCTQTRNHRWLITSLHQDFMLTDKGDVRAFLGLDINQNEIGQLELMQFGLIKKMIEECSLNKQIENSMVHQQLWRSYTRMKKGPWWGRPSGSTEQSLECWCTWVGHHDLILPLQFAVHQCAC